MTKRNQDFVVLKKEVTSLWCCQTFPLNLPVLNQHLLSKHILVTWQHQHIPTTVHNQKAELQFVCAISTASVNDYSSYKCKEITIFKLLHNNIGIWQTHMCINYNKLYNLQQNMYDMPEGLNQRLCHRRIKQKIVAQEKSTIRLQSNA
jgi:hypothetical protein